MDTRKLTGILVLMLVSLLISTAISEIAATSKAEGIKMDKGKAVKNPKIQTRIDMPAPSKEPGNTYARGMSAALSHLGTNISYDQIMGLTGTAFILQLDTSGPFIDGELDCAWWPNDAWGFDLGLPVLSKATGWDIRKIKCDNKAFKADPAAEYRRILAPAIEKSLKNGRPVLAEHDLCFIITAVDSGNPPLLGYCSLLPSTRFEGSLIRAASYPWGLIVFGDKTAPADQAEADLTSLRHIVALFDEQAQGADAPKTRFAGRRAWEEWLKLLRKGSACDNNMLIHLRYNRRSAIAYLRDMAKRYSGKTAEHLNAAAELYQQELDELMKQKLPYGRVQKGESPQVVRAEYTSMVERVFKLETQAIEHLRKAIKAAGQKSSKIKNTK